MSLLESNGSPSGDSVRDDSFLPLLIALMLMLVLIPMLQPLPLLTSAIASLAMLAGLLAVHRDRKFRSVVFGLLVICMPLRWAAQFLGHTLSWLILASHISLGASFAVLEVFVLSRVLSHSKVTRETVFGAICGYLMIGLFFVFVFAAVTFLKPDAISISGVPLEAEKITNLDKHVSELAYFSFITLTTVGYGDILPTVPLTRSLAVTEALIGQLYLAAFVARLVGAMSAPPDKPQ